MISRSWLLSKQFPDQSEATDLSQNTHVKYVQTDSVSDVSLLLDLGGLAVDRIESDAFGGRVVHVVTADESACACPSCGVFSTCDHCESMTRWGGIAGNLERPERRHW